MALFAEREDKTHKAAMETFSDRVVKLALSIPAGRVSTYGAIAKAAGGGGFWGVGLGSADKRRGQIKPADLEG